jgi:glutamate synthase domain-containing protein 2
MRREFFIGSAIVILLVIAGYFVLPDLYRPFHISLSLILGSILIIGFKDAFQKRQAIKRNFPFIGNFRYMLEMIRPEIQQYFIETNTDGKPFSREERSVVYQRSKGVLDTVPFGTQEDVYRQGYEWVNHSLQTTHVNPTSLRIIVGGPDCKRPYNASILNISAMSFGSLSKEAILSLNGGAKDGEFAHNTGEGSISDHHLENGGDIIWQIGTGYFGCRTMEGEFCPDKFSEKSNLDVVKMIEIKLSQGAKPGHGGILPAEKVTAEISRIRNVPIGSDVKSPSNHSQFSGPIELLNFVKKLRDLSGGKPVGFKLCLGKRREFMAICKAMIKTGVKPDFITVDGGEGGTGAAPVEFTNHIGSPGIDALVFIHNALTGFGLRKDIKIICTGKISSGYGIVKKLSLGADLTYAARSMMMALGCIQALRCNSNDCPTGVATQDTNLTAGLVVSDKRKRVGTFHAHTVESAAEIMGAMGLNKTSELRPWHLMARVADRKTKNFFEIYHYVNEDDFLKGIIPEDLKYCFDKSSPDHF